MKITINISKKDMEHLNAPHTFSDECEPACRQLRKLQRAINKRIKERKQLEKIFKGLKNE
jgi:hypothetical protein